MVGPTHPPPATAAAQLDGPCAALRSRRGQARDATERSSGKRDGDQRDGARSLACCLGLRGPPPFNFVHPTCTPAALYSPRLSASAARNASAITCVCVCVRARVCVRRFFYERCVWIKEKEKCMCELITRIKLFPWGTCVINNGNDNLRTNTNGPELSPRLRSERFFKRNVHGSRK